MLTNKGLMRIKTRAVRNGIWFRLLSGTDRAILDLTIRYVEKVRSRVLTRTILEIISKVLKALGDNFMEKAERFGQAIAGRASKMAEKWGNKNAPRWIFDKSFIRFLGVTALNT